MSKASKYYITLFPTGDDDQKHYEMSIYLFLHVLMHGTVKTEMLHCYKRSSNATLYMFLQVVTNGPLTVTEGGDVEYIEITTTLPPRFICASSETLASVNGTCEITVFAILGIESGYRKCSDGTIIPQAVIGWPHTYSDDIIVPCGIKVTGMNWLGVLQLAVKAKLDLIKDMDYKEQLTISQKLSVDTVETIAELKVIEVGVFSDSFLHNIRIVAHLKEINSDHIIAYDDRCKTVYTFNCFHVVYVE